eukprot:m.53925 g.53925  ORF g.53925 m.53925 type:complete len:154 (-) comp11067_c0_seq2:1099-1560(-)
MMNSEEKNRFNPYANLNLYKNNRGGKGKIVEQIFHDVPSTPFRPNVLDVTAESVLLTWDAVGQGVSILKLQAVVVKKSNTKAPWKRFNPRKGVGRETVITKGADLITSAVVSGVVYLHPLSCCIDCMMCLFWLPKCVIQPSNCNVITENRTQY